MPQPPARHSRLFELLRQQSQARAVAERLDARRDLSPETVIPLARINGQSLLHSAQQPSQQPSGTTV